MIGSGYQAQTQLEAICKVRPITSARVYSRSAEHREAFARLMSERLGIDVTPAGTSREAVDGVDVVTTITASRTPVFDGDWLEDGTHVNAAGGANEYVIELDDATILRADTIVVDDIAQARIECGELMMPASRGLILWEQLHELCEIAGGIVPGRLNSRDVTLFKSLGMAMWDVAAARVVYDKAIAQGVGVNI
jgi:ornithine cyclodeaminase/alanine dehydrogenase-like protein (mu-crystallin family)